MKDVMKKMGVVVFIGVICMVLSSCKESELPTSQPQAIHTESGMELLSVYGYDLYGYVYKNLNTPVEGAQIRVYMNGNSNEPIGIDISDAQGHYQICDINPNNKPFPWTVLCIYPNGDTLRAILSRDDFSGSNYCGTENPHTDYESCMEIFRWIPRNTE